MLWILISLFFFWLIFREIYSTIVAPKGFDRPTSTQINKPYMAGLIVLALLFAWPPFHYWHFEHYLSGKATIIADEHRAKVHCNTIVDTFIDTHVFAAGHANPKTGEIVFQYPWCNRLMTYLNHPAIASREEITSLNILTHESMHVRGEYNEARTECEAVQRNFRTAMLLGVSEQIAKKNALDYYYGDYMRRGQIGGLAGSYFSSECAPGKAMDEHLSDSTWAAP